MSRSALYWNHGDAPGSRRVVTIDPAATSVLIVDDNDDVHGMYTGYLRREGFVVLNAHDGREGLHLARTSLPDVIVLDLAMPGMTGWEVMREIKKDSTLRGLRIVVVTGFPGLFASGEALDVRADAYRMKPCLPADLVRAVRQVARSSRATAAKSRRRR